MSGPLVSTVRSRTPPRRAARRCKVDDASMPIAPPVPTMSTQLLGDARLGARVLSEAGRELLGTHGHRTAAHALGDAFVDEHVEVTPDRHLAHVELVGRAPGPARDHRCRGDVASARAVRVPGRSSGDLLRVAQCRTRPPHVLEDPQRDALNQRSRRPFASTWAT